MRGALGWAALAAGLLAPALVLVAEWPGAADRAARARAPVARRDRRRARLDVVGAGRSARCAAASPRSCACCSPGAGSRPRRRRSGPRTRGPRDATRDRARSAAPSPRCGADAAAALHGPDRRRRAPRSPTAPRRSLWGEPVSALYARVQQGRLDDELAALERAEPTPVERRVLARLPDPRRRQGFAARALGAPRAARRRARAAARAGGRAGRRRRGGHGRAATCATGPGHYPGTALPGQRGTVAIAGHRTTYGAPFRHLDDLERGDRIELAMPYGRFAYRVEAQPHRRAGRDVGHPPRGVRSAGADRLPSALLRRRADRGVRPPRRASGEDPMDQDPRPADAAHAMTTALRYQPAAGTLRTGGPRRGRKATQGQAMQTDGADERFERLDYEVDADAVAAAIVSRLLAGGTLPAARAATTGRRTPSGAPTRAPGSVLEAAPGGRARPRRSRPARAGRPRTSPIQVSRGGRLGRLAVLGRDADAQLEVLAAGRAQLGRVAAERVRDLGHAGRERQRRRRRAPARRRRPRPGGARRRRARRRGRASRARPPRRARGPRPAAGPGAGSGRSGPRRGRPPVRRRPPGRGPRAARARRRRRRACRSRPRGRRAARRCGRRADRPRRPSRRR